MSNVVDSRVNLMPSLARSESTQKLSSKDRCATEFMACVVGALTQTLTQGFSSLHLERGPSRAKGQERFYQTAEYLHVKEHRQGNTEEELEREIKILNAVVQAFEEQEKDVIYLAWLWEQYQSNHDKWDNYRLFQVLKFCQYLCKKYFKNDPYFVGHFLLDPHKPLWNPKDALDSIKLMLDRMGISANAKSVVGATYRMRMQFAQTIRSLLSRKEFKSLELAAQGAEAQVRFFFMALMLMMLMIQKVTDNDLQQDNRQLRMDEINTNAQKLKYEKIEKDYKKLIESQKRAWWLNLGMTIIMAIGAVIACALELYPLAVILVGMIIANNVHNSDGDNLIQMAGKGMAKTFNISKAAGEIIMIAIVTVVTAVCTFGMGAIVGGVLISAEVGIDAAEAATEAGAELAETAADSATSLTSEVTAETVSSVSEEVGGVVSRVLRTMLRVLKQILRVCVRAVRKLANMIGSKLGAVLLVTGFTLQDCSSDISELVSENNEKGREALKLTLMISAMIMSLLGGLGMSAGASVASSASNVSSTSSVVESEGASIGGRIGRYVSQGLKNIIMANYSKIYTVIKWISVISMLSQAGIQSGMYASQVIIADVQYDASIAQGDLKLLQVASRLNAKGIEDNREIIRQAIQELNRITKSCSAPANLEESYARALFAG